MTNHRWPARAARAVILAAVAATLTLGSQAAVAHATGVPGLPGQAPEKSCNLGFMPVKPTVTAGPSTSILGNAWAECDVPPERHDLTLSLQYLQGGVWKTDRSTTGTAIPTPGRREVYEVKTGCQPGVWRVNASVVGTLQGRNFDFTDNSISRIVSAEECARGRS